MGGVHVYGCGVMDENGQVIPSPRPVVMTKARPDMPENETVGIERDHDRSSNFNLGFYRQTDDLIYHP